MGRLIMDEWGPTDKVGAGEVGSQPDKREGRTPASLGASQTVDPSLMQERAGLLPQGWESTTDPVAADYRAGP